MAASTAVSRASPASSRASPTAVKAASAPSRISLSPLVRGASSAAISAAAASASSLLMTASNDWMREPRTARNPRDAPALTVGTPPGKPPGMALPTSAGLASPPTDDNCLTIELNAGGASLGADAAVLPPLLLAASAPLASAAVALASAAPLASHSAMSPAPPSGTMLPRPPSLMDSKPSSVRSSVIAVHSACTTDVMAAGQCHICSTPSLRPTHSVCPPGLASVANALRPVGTWRIERQTRPPRKSHSLTYPSVPAPMTRGAPPVNGTIALR
mmetsp:Transcript_47819/g.95472  ORF Transcript_47819/g.95472 Transcript_47819/m.95472 type:complete len:273 (+) Transcript_47819:338-1156(+)